MSREDIEHKITKEDIAVCWGHHADSFLADILNNTYDLAEARGDLLSLINSEYDSRTKDIR